MRFGSARRRRRVDQVTLNLASMIDVTFLLLIYFMVVTSIVKPEDRLSPTLQTITPSAAGPTSDFQRQVIEVEPGESGPVYRLGNRLINDRRALESVLRELPKEAGLFVNVHEDVPVAFAVAALQAAHDVGFDQVTYVPVE